MVSMKKTLSGKNIAYAECNVFIIPNKACAATEYCIESEQKRRADYVKLICDLNEKNYDINDKLYHIGFDSEELGENLADHGFTIDVDGESYWCHFSNYRVNGLPKQLLPEKEGDKFTIILPCKGEELNRDEKNTIEFRLVLTMIAKQGNSSFGNSFEQVMRNVG